MAAPKPKPTHPNADFWGLPPDDEPIEFDEDRLEALLKEPGVIVHRRDPERARQFKPLQMVGQMSYEEFMWLLGRAGDGWDDWYASPADQDEDESDDGQTPAAVDA